MTRRAAAAALALSLLLPCPAPGEEPPRGPQAPPPVFAWEEAGALALADANDVLGGPLRWDGADWLKLGAAGAAVVATGFALDRWLRDASQRSRTAGRDDAATAIQCLGSACAFAVLGGFAVYGLAAKDREALDVAVDGALASAIAWGIAAPVAKLTVGRARPNAEQGPSHFDPFSGDASFPSGHTTLAFSVASVVAAHDGRLWVKVAAFGLAGSVGFARVHLDAHWASDVLAGAILGTAVGTAVVKVNARIREGPGRTGGSRGGTAEGMTMALWPVFLRKGGGVSIVASF